MDKFQDGKHPQFVCQIQQELYKQLMINMIKEKILNFLNSIESFKMFLSLSFMLDITSTFGIIYRLGIEYEGNPILRFLIPQPYFPLVYTGAVSLIMFCVKDVWRSIRLRYVFWIVFFLIFLASGFANTMYLLGVFK